MGEMKRKREEVKNEGGEEGENKRKKGETDR